LLIKTHKFKMKKFKFQIILLILLFSVCSWYACQKQNDVVNTKTDDVLALVSADGRSYDYDKYGKMFYDHMKYHDGVFPAENYVTSKELRSFLEPNNLNTYLAQQDVLFPTLSLKLNDCVAKRIFTEAAKNMILQYESDIIGYLSSATGNLTFTTVENFIVSKETAIMNRTDVSYEEKMSVLSISSYVKYFLKLKYDEHLLRTASNTAQLRSACPWYTKVGCVAGVIGGIVGSLKGAAAAAGVGATVGAVFGGVGAPIGAFVGAAIGFTVGVAATIKIAKDCEKECTTVPTPPTPADPCKPSTNLAVKIKGCGLTQQVVAVGQGANVNVFTGQTTNSTPSTIISSTPVFTLTQQNASTPVNVNIVSSCPNGTSTNGIIGSFNFAEMVKDVGFVEFVGSSEGCVGQTDCYSLAGSFANNPNNLPTMSVPSGNENYDIINNSDGTFCVKWKKEGSFTFSTTVTNLCGGGTIQKQITVDVKKRAQCE
jgi:hypothetical protein